MQVREVIMRINLGGAFSKKQQIVPFVIKNKHVLKSFETVVFDGINNCPWNGGRINRDIQHDDKTIDFYYRHNIGIALTFTNPHIDLKNTIGNKLLEKFHREGNYIISINPELRQYVRKNFPRYKHTRSITGFGNISVPMSDDDLQLYKELERDYDFIVPRTEHVFDPRFSQLNVSKYEIMVNDTCVYGCPLYKKHFEAIAEQNIKYSRPWKQAGVEKMTEVEECWIPGFDPCTGHKETKAKLGENYGMDLNTSQVKRLLEQGVVSFKLTGREMSHDQYNEVLDYILNMHNHLI